MNDTNHIPSPAHSRHTVGNSARISGNTKPVQILERNDTSSLNVMWCSFIRQASPSVVNLSKPLTSPRISLYDSCYGTRIPNTESGEGVVADTQTIQILDYFPYGGERVNTGANESAKTYIGLFSDDATDLLYANARYLAPSRGQFISQDPVFNEDPRMQKISNPQSLNSYSYANGNPIVDKDPTGRCVDGVSTLVCLGAWGLLGAIVGGNGLLMHGAMTENTEVAQMGLALSDIGLIGGSGVGLAKGSTNLISGSSNWSQNPNQSVIPGVTNLPNASLVAQCINSGEVTINGPYARPSNATNIAQRQSVQGAPCVSCGSRSSTMVANHSDALVVQHYSQGSIDFTKMRSVKSVDAQCTSCSARQGGLLRAWSIDVKSKIDWKKINVKTK